MQAQQVAVETANDEYGYEPPVHVQRSRKGVISHKNVDIFEFTCAAEWHKPFVVHSFDRSSYRGSPGMSERERQRQLTLVQVGALVSLVCGLSSWIYKNHVFIDTVEPLRMVRSVQVGDKIRIIFEALELGVVKRLRIRIECGDRKYKYTPSHVSDGMVICDDEVRIAPFPARRLRHSK